MIKVMNISVKASSGKVVLENVSCTACAGSITTLVGKSGAGKTTLLRAVAGLNMYDIGSIEVDGTDLKTCTPVQRASLVGFVFQDFNLFENLTVLENCVQPMVVVKNQEKLAATRQAADLLSQLSMTQMLGAHPKNLSGGQRQRVAIARALCMGSKTLLLDEPTSALDPENSANLVAILKKLCQQGIAILMSSQDMSFVKQASDLLFLLDDGRIIDFYDPQISGLMSEQSRLFNFMNLI